MVTHIFDRHRTEQGRLVLDLLLLLDAWNKPVSITEIEAGLTLMGNELTVSELANLCQAIENNNSAIRRVCEDKYELAKPELLTGASQANRDRATEAIRKTCE